MGLKVSSILRLFSGSPRGGEGDGEDMIDGLFSVALPLTKNMIKFLLTLF
jgi:hypothetical protein